MTKTTINGLQTRFAFVRAYLIDRGVTRPFQVLGTMDPRLKKDEDLIRQWWNSRRRVKPEDRSVLERLEKAVEQLKENAAV